MLPDPVSWLFGEDVWRLLWPISSDDHGWRVILHHQALTIHQPPPTHKVEKGDRGITIRNQTPALIYVHRRWRRRFWIGRGDGRYRSPGESWHFDPSKDRWTWAYSVNVSYWVGDPAKIPRKLVDTFWGVDRNWRLLWETSRRIGDNDTLTVSQPPPDAQIGCPSVDGSLHQCGRCKQFPNF